MKKYLFAVLASLTYLSQLCGMSLEEFDAKFQEASQKGQFQRVIDEQKQMEQPYQKKQHKIDFIKQKLEEERNQELLKMCDASDLEICRLIQRVTHFRLTHIQVEALKYLESLRTQALQSSLSPLENKLIAIDFEYESKDLFVDQLFEEGKLTLKEKKGMHVLHKIERMNKMVEAAAASNEHYLARLVEEADQVLGSYHQHQADLETLDALARGSAVPDNPIEEQAKEIVLTYQIRLAQAEEQHLASN